MPKGIFQQNFVKNSILTKKLEKTEQSKQKKNLIARVKRWFSTRLNIFDRFKHFCVKIISAASIAPKLFSLQLFPLAYCCKWKFELIVASQK